jgi:acyl-CoA thioesterase I
MMGSDMKRVTLQNDQEPAVQQEPNEMTSARMRRRRLLRRWGHCSVLAAFALLGVQTSAAANGTPTPAGKPAAHGGSIVVVGDSLSAEYGLARGTGWVSLLGVRLRTKHPEWTVVNGSISGDTTAGGRSRLPALIAQHHPRIVIVELGGNDALRGLPVSGTRDNLQAMAQMAKAAGAKVVLVGMQVPPNYGPSYTKEFAATFSDVSAREKTALVPFLLKGVADRPDARDWFQADGIHPIARAHPILLDNVWTVLQPLLK